MVKRGLVIQFILLLFLTSGFFESGARVQIREKVAIDPKPSIFLAPTEIATQSDPLFTVSAGQPKTTVPGVMVSASLLLLLSEVPTGTAIEVFISAGGTSMLVRRLAKGCDETVTSESYDFPPKLLENCGTVSASMHVWNRSLSTPYCSSYLGVSTSSANASGSIPGIRT